MSINIDLLKDKNRELYLEIESISQSNNNQARKIYKNKIKNFLDEIVKDAVEIEYIDDYTWVNDTVTFWERFLESEYPEIAHYIIPKPLKPLVDRKSPEDNPVISKILEKIRSKLPVDGTRPILLKGMPLLDDSTVFESLDIRINRVLKKNVLERSLTNWNLRDCGYEIKILLKHVTSYFKLAPNRLGKLESRETVIYGEWYSYKKATEVLANVTKKINQTKKTTKTNGVKQPMLIVVLSDYAFKIESKHSIEKSLQRVDISDYRFQLWEGIYAIQQQLDITLIYCIDRVDFKFGLANSSQEDYWEVLEVTYKYKDLADSTAMKEDRILSTNGLTPKFATIG
jgi:hypothetical protein